MKKGKTSKVQGFKNMKVNYGTVDSLNLKSVYLNIQTWVEPTKDSTNWSRVILNMSRAIKHLILDLIDLSFFEEKFIVDLDLRSSGITTKKKSFLNLEINFYVKDPTFNFKSPKLKTYMKDFSKNIWSEIFQKNDYFKFCLNKTKGIKKDLVIQS